MNTCYTALRLSSLVVKQYVDYKVMVGHTRHLHSECSQSERPTD